MAKLTRVKITSKTMDKMNMRISNPGMEDSQESAVVSAASVPTGGPHFITSVQMENSSSTLATAMQIA